MTSSWSVEGSSSGLAGAAEEGGGGGGEEDWPGRSIFFPVFFPPRREERGGRGGARERMSVSLVSSSLAFSLSLSCRSSLSLTHASRHGEKGLGGAVRGGKGERDLLRKRERERERRAKSESQMAEQATNTLRNENATCFRLWKKKAFCGAAAAAPSGLGHELKRRRTSPNPRDSSFLS